MNVLFLNNSEVSPQNSGIQRVTTVLADEFSKNGIKCYSVFFSHNQSEPKANFEEKYLLNKKNVYEQLENILVTNKINFVICQEVVGNKLFFKNIRRAVKKIEHCKSVYCLHNTPEHIYSRPNIFAELVAVFQEKKYFRLKKLAVCLMPEFLYNWINTLITRRKYQVLNKNFDYIMLLSDSFKQSYFKISNISKDDKEKVIAINNLLSFQQNIDSQQISQKENIILIVSRLWERQKRISESLKIWKKVQQKTDINNWKLVIVGIGEDEKYLKSLAKKLNIKEVYFEGRQNPIEYYRKSSIFMMTSAYEGFPMVLGEAQQMGVVPIVCDTYGAVHDIIENDFDGIIIEKNNTEKYVNQLITLMQNDEKRQILAKNALESCKKFSTENIIEKWRELFEKPNI